MYKITRRICSAFVGVFTNKACLPQAGFKHWLPVPLIVVGENTNNGVDQPVINDNQPNRI